MSGRTVLILGAPEPLAQAVAQRFAQEGDFPVRGSFDPGSSSPAARDLRALVESRARPVAVLVTILPPPEAPATAGGQSLLEVVARHCWPLVETFRQTGLVSGAPPRQVLVLAPEGGPFQAGAAQAVNEVLIRYLNHRFSPQGSIFNLLRTEFREDRCEPAARMAYALTSGAMDAVRGQIIRLNGAA